MKVAIVGNSAKTLILFRLDLISSLIQEGNEVYAFSPGFTDELKARIEEVGAIPVECEISRAGLNPISELQVITELRKKFKEKEIELVLSYFIKPVIYGSIAAYLAGVKEIFSMIAGLGYAFTENPTRSFELKRSFVRNVLVLFFKLALSFNRKVFFQNPADYDFFIQKKIISKNKGIRVNGSGVNLEKFQFSNPVTNPVVFITTGRLIKEKGFTEFIEAARLLKSSQSNARFVILGGIDKNPNSLKEEDIKKWSQEGIIEWYGVVENVHQWLTQSSVFVLTSYYREGIPRSTLEAISTGRPVITTNLPGCREPVKEGVNGFLIEPRDPGKLALTMKKFLDHPDLIRSMGIESRKIAEENYDVWKINRKLIKEMGLLILPERKA